jgi:hypothetical protein
MGKGQLEIQPNGERDLHSANFIRPALRLFRLQLAYAGTWVLLDQNYSKR